MITYTYNLSSFKTYSAEGLNKIIKSCTLNIIATNASGQEHSNVIPVEFEEPEQRTFIDYSSLREEEVIEWVEAALGEELAAIKYGMSSYLEEQTRTVLTVNPRENPTEEESSPWISDLN